MSCGIGRLEVRDRSLDPVQAELWITVEPDEPAADLDVRGRLVGPRCPYASTVELAYPLRPLAGAVRKGTALTRRVLIPEASLWDPQSPFVYQGIVELWQAGRLCARREVSHGLRQLTLTRRGLCCNGRHFPLQGREAAPTEDAELLELRRQGCNLLLLPHGAPAASVAERAERLGMLVLVRGSSDLAEELAGRASYLGRLTAGPDAGGGRPGGGLVGWEVGDDLPAPLPSAPAGASFAVCSVAQVEALRGLGLPLLVRGSSRELAELARPEEAPWLGEIVSASLE